MTKSYPTLDKLEEQMAAMEGTWYITAPNSEDYKTLSLLWYNSSSNITNVLSERSVLLAALILTSSPDAQSLLIENPCLYTKLSTIVEDTNIYIIPDADTNDKPDISIFCDQTRQADHPYITVLDEVLTVISEQELNDYLEKSFETSIYGNSILNYCDYVGNILTFDHY